jgi:hypothetical protein
VSLVGAPAANGAFAGTMVNGDSGLANQLKLISILGY